jgi:DNA-binding IclR family transcriptional regulator
VNYLAEQSQLGKATATQIAGAVGMNRATVSRILNGGEEFIEVEQIGREVFYGVRSDLT